MSEVNISNEVREIPIKQFLEMDSGYNKYPNSDKIHLNQTTKTGEYVTNERFKDMLNREIAYRYAHNMQRPSGVWIVHKPDISKPQLIQDIEKLGMPINTMSDLYHSIQKYGVYNHINCLQGATTDSIVNGITKQYNNCTRYTYLGKKVSDALNSMGKKYTTQIVHVDCENSRHFPDPKLGHYFLFVTGEEFKTKTCFDLAEAASGKRGIGSTMCVNGYKIIGYDKLC